MSRSKFLGLVLALFFVWGAAPLALADSDDTATVIMFGRDDCRFCQAEKVFLDGLQVDYKYYDVVKDAEASRLFGLVAEKHDLAKVTPLTIVGERVFQGFNSSETTGRQIQEAVLSEGYSGIKTVEDHLRKAPKQNVLSDSGCDEEGIECDTKGEEYIFDLPFVGLVDLKSLSLFSLSVILGAVDGFNPCAMWVLITFLILLSQAGSRRKMFFLAGVFILAEAIMYNLILNVWYSAWDFVALDQVVTPLVGFLAVGGGLFFLWRWRKNRDVALVCDISDIDSQTKMVDKFKSVVNQPLTLATFVAIVVIAFSVNIIEFACSIGIPQAYTKILELNSLDLLTRQFYLLIYTVGYMLDDFIVFGLAIWGYSKLEAHGHKYSQLSLVIGGVLMLVLGLILVFNPDILVL